MRHFYVITYKMKAASALLQAYQTSSATLADRITLNMAEEGLAKIWEADSGSHGGSSNPKEPMADHESHVQLMLVAYTLSQLRASPL